MSSILNATTSSGLVTSADNSGSLQLATNNGTTAVTIDTSQNVGIGLTPPVGSGNYRSLNVGATFIYGNTGLAVAAYNNNADINDKYIITGVASSYTQSSGNHIWYNAASGSAGASISFTERMRIDSSGNVLIGKTSQTNTGKLEIDYSRATHAGTSYNETSSSSTCTHIAFQRGGTGVGSISSPNNSSVAYNTSSDYRLKENIAPMTGALDVVQQLKPVTYKWKVDGSDGQGFIAHELAEVVPDCVTGEKDAVETYTDEDGNEQTRIKPQGIDTSFLVATLTAAIQEQQAQIEELKAEVQALKGTL
jgi:hypothetical protein